MKKFLPILIVLILVATAAGIASTNSVWASMLPDSWKPGEDQSDPFAPPLKKITVTADGLYNIGGVCTVEIDYLVAEMQTIADSEVPNTETKLVLFNGDGKLLFPGCHFVHSKQNQVVNPMVTTDGTAKVCFGASPSMLMTVWYYQDSTPPANRVWLPLPATLEDNGRLVCAPAQYSGVYMPAGKIVPNDDPASPGYNRFYEGNIDGSIVTPPTKITINGSGTYNVGGICRIKAEYKVPGLSDVVEVEYPTRHYTEETLTVPSEAVAGVFYFPGCHVLHMKDNVIRDSMTRAEGDWEICFAEIPGKKMTIYYYRDNMTTIIAPWIALTSTTANGMVCASLVDFSAVYVPAGE